MMPVCRDCGVMQATAEMRRLPRRRVGRKVAPEEHVCKEKLACRRRAKSLSEVLVQPRNLA